MTADVLEEMTLCDEVFHTPSGVAFAGVITGGHRETWPIRSKRFRTWVQRCYYRATGAAPSGSAIGSALDLLEARAQFDAPLPPWLSDALCRIASGGSFAVRRLYTDDEEVLFKAARPILLNGIEDVIGRPDLADRAIFLSLGPIGEEQRRSET